MIRIRTLVAVLVIAVPVPVAVAGCGGGSSSNNEDPNQVLKETFNNNTKITSGHMNISLSGSAEGTQSGNLSATIDGPFQGDASNPNTFPQLDLTAKVSASGAGQSFNFDGSLITTKDNAYVDYQNQAYEVGTQIYQQFAKQYQQSASQGQSQNQSQSASSILNQFGVDPTTWLTNVTNEGTTDVSGTQTIHIHGDADVSQIVSDLNKIAQQAGNSTQSITPAQIDQVKSAVKTASIDVYSAESDKTLRKLSLTLDLAPPSSTGVTAVNVNFSVTLSDVNQPQTITAPANAKPISDLLGQFGVSGGALGALGASAGSAGGGLPSGTAAGANAQAYSQCLQGATTAADIQKCAQQLK
ncbi:MAG: hypothetical protein ACRDK1_00125 [Solirubrobacterales bacterium]